MASQRNVNDIGTVGAAVAANVNRLRRGQSLRDLSAKLADLGRPISADGLNKIERGVRKVDVDDLAALASVLGVHPVELLVEPIADDPFDFLRRVVAPALVPRLGRSFRAEINLDGPEQLRVAIGSPHGAGAADGND